MNRSFPTFGTAALALAGGALALTVVHFYAGPFAAQHSTGVTVGSLAAEIVQSAKDKLTGQPLPEPVARPWDIDRGLKLAVALGAALALVLVVVGAVRHEPPRLLIGAGVLGASAILFQFFVTLAFALIGVLLIWVILQSLPDWLTG